MTRKKKLPIKEAISRGYAPRITGRTRVFDGKRYHAIKYFTSKREAQKAAEHYRKTFYVRVVKTPINKKTSLYWIYVRSKR